MNQVQVENRQPGPALVAFRRILKIENAGDPWRRQTVSTIRLKGQWLTKAGFQPGHRVSVTLLSPGTLEVRLTDRAIPNCECPAELAQTPLLPGTDVTNSISGSPVTAACSFFILKRTGRGPGLNSTVRRAKSINIGVERSLCRRATFQTC